MLCVTDRGRRSAYAVASPCQHTHGLCTCVYADTHSPSLRNTGHHSRNPCNYMDHYSFTNPGGWKAELAIVGLPIADSLPTCARVVTSTRDRAQVRESLPTKAIQTHVLTTDLYTVVCGLSNVFRSLQVHVLTMPTCRSPISMLFYLSTVRTHEYSDVTLSDNRLIVSSIGHAFALSAAI